VVPVGSKASTELELGAEGRARILHRSGLLDDVRIRRDVANVEDGVENSRLAAWIATPMLSYQPAVLLDIQRQPGANIIETVERVKKILPRLTASLPAGIHLAIFSDRTETIRASVRDVQFTLVLTIGLVVLVLLMFLRRLRATIIPSVALPLSLLGTFAVMYLAGYSLDNLSLMALTLAVGLRTSMTRR
jgi:multidrug efflux pump